MEEKEPSCAIGRNVNWYSHYGRQFGVSLKKLGVKVKSESEVAQLYPTPNDPMDCSLSGYSDINIFAFLS